MRNKDLINFMAVTESGSLNSVNAEDVKNMHYIGEKLEDCIKEVGAQNVIQIITNNTYACNECYYGEQVSSYLLHSLYSVHS